MNTILLGPQIRLLYAISSSYGALQVLWIYGIRKQRRLIGDTHSEGLYVSIPVNYPHPFDVVGEKFDSNCMQLIALISQSFIAYWAQSFVRPRHITESAATWIF